MSNVINAAINIGSGAYYLARTVVAPMVLPKSVEKALQAHDVNDKETKWQMV